MYSCCWTTRAQDGRWGAWEHRNETAGDGSQQLCGSHVVKPRTMLTILCNYCFS